MSDTKSAAQMILDAIARETPEQRKRREQAVWKALLKGLEKIEERTERNRFKPEDLNRYYGPW